MCAARPLQGEPVPSTAAVSSTPAALVHPLSLVRPPLRRSRRCRARPALVSVPFGGLPRSTPPIASCSTRRGPGPLRVWWRLPTTRARAGAVSVAAGRRRRAPICWCRSFFAPGWASTSSICARWPWRWPPFRRASAAPAWRRTSSGPTTNGGSRKLGGILAEVVPAGTATGQAVVVGLGLNVGWPPREETGRSAARRAAGSWPRRSGSRRKPSPSPSTFSGCCSKTSRGGSSTWRIDPGVGAWQGSIAAGATPWGRPCASAARGGLHGDGHRHHPRGPSGGGRRGLPQDRGGRRRGPPAGTRLTPAAGHLELCSRACLPGVGDAPSTIAPP